MTVSLPTAYQQVIHKTRYARWMEEENRREDWHETVSRFVNYVVETLSKYNNYEVSDELKSRIEDAILKTNVMPSMRGLMTAGPALERDSTCLYNCSYLPVDSLRSFDEAMYILMCGTGVGYSVESKYVNQLPVINEHFENSSTSIVVDDSKAGWAKALRELIALLYQGQVPSWDVSNVRPAGARLKTFGGRASGPEPRARMGRWRWARGRGVRGCPRRRCGRHSRRRPGRFRGASRRTSGRRGCAQSPRHCGHGQRGLGGQRGDV